MNLQKLNNFVKQYAELVKSNSQYFDNAKNRAERIDFLAADYFLW